MSAQTFLKNLLNMRGAMLKKGVCKKDVWLMRSIFHNTKTWVDAYKPTEEQCRSYVMRHSDEINVLLPGGNTPQAATWKKRFDELVGA